MSIRLVIGLGNPGGQYADTRHNVGAAVVELLAESNRAVLKKHTSRCRVADIRLGTLPGGAPGSRVTLAIAQSYMNVSGGPLARLAHYLGISPEEILVIHDDLDIPAHCLRLKHGGGEGGHNGLRSISENLSTKEYSRLRIGVGRPPGRMSAADYVLEKIPTRDRSEWDVTYHKAAEVVADVVNDGFIPTQQTLHSGS